MAVALGNTSDDREAHCTLIRNTTLHVHTQYEQAKLAGIVRGGRTSYEHAMFCNFILPENTNIVDVSAAAGESDLSLLLRQHEMRLAKSI